MLAPKRPTSQNTYPQGTEKMGMASPILYDFRCSECLKLFEEWKVLQVKHLKYVKNLSGCKKNCVQHFKLKCRNYSHTKYFNSIDEPELLTSRELLILRKSMLRSLKTTKSIIMNGKPVVSFLRISPVQELKISLSTPRIIIPNHNIRMIDITLQKDQVPTLRQFRWLTKLKQIKIKIHFTTLVEYQDQISDYLKYNFDHLEELSIEIEVGYEEEEKMDTAELTGEIWRRVNNITSKSFHRLGAQVKLFEKLNRLSFDSLIELLPTRSVDFTFLKDFQNLTVLSMSTCLRGMCTPTFLNCLSLPSHIKVLDLTLELIGSPVEVTSSRYAQLFELSSLKHLGITFNYSPNLNVQNSEIAHEISMKIISSVNSDIEELFIEFQSASSDRIEDFFNLVCKKFTQLKVSKFTFNNDKQLWYNYDKPIFPQLVHFETQKVRLHESVLKNLTPTFLRILKIDGITYNNKYMTREILPLLKDISRFTNLEVCVFKVFLDKEGNLCCSSDSSEEDSNSESDSDDDSSTSAKASKKRINDPQNLNENDGFFSKALVSLEEMTNNLKKLKELYINIPLCMSKSELNKVRHLIISKKQFSKFRFGVFPVSLRLLKFGLLIDVTYYNCFW